MDELKNSRRVSNSRMVPAMAPVFCLCSAGAYGFVMASNYNSRGRAAEIMVDGDEFHIVRERETIEDLVRGEKTI